MTVALALMAATVYGLAVAAQFSQAAAADAKDSLRPRLLIGLVVRPVWLLGLVGDMGGFALQTAALATGSLVVVQPILTLSLVVSLPVGARLQRRSLRRWEWLAIAGTVGGLAVFYLAARPTAHSHASASRNDWMALLVVVTAIIGISLASGRMTAGVPRAMLFGLAAATAEAMMAVTSEAFGDRLGAGVWSTFRSWQPYGVAVCGVITLLLVQSAYQVGLATATLPTLTVAEPIIATTIGIALFGERLHIGGWRGPMALASLAVTTHSLVLIARRSATSSSTT